MTQVNPIMLARKAPHPNAARLFYDFVLSKEGQEHAARASSAFRCAKMSSLIRRGYSVASNRRRGSGGLQRLRRIGEAVPGDFQIAIGR